MTLWVAHSLLAIVAFFCVNWLGPHAVSSGYYQLSFIADFDDAPAFNTVFRVLAPIVFLVVAAGLCYAAGLDGLVVNFYRVTVLYYGLRWCFSVLTRRALLLNWPRQVGRVAQFSGPFVS